FEPGDVLGGEPRFLPVDVVAQRGVHLRILVDRAVHVEFLPHGLLLHLELGQPIVDAEESTVNAVHGTLPMIWHRWAGDTMAHRAGVAELADARHSKCRAHVACGFESRLRHPHPTSLPVRSEVSKPFWPRRWGKKRRDSRACRTLPVLTRLANMANDGLSGG